MHHVGNVLTWPIKIPVSIVLHRQPQTAKLVCKTARGNASRIHPTLLSQTRASSHGGHLNHPQIITIFVSVHIVLQIAVIVVEYKLGDALRIEEAHK